MRRMDDMDEPQDVRVEWHWALPPFRAYWRTPNGNEMGVARWTPGAARQRAYELRDHWMEVTSRSRDDDRRTEARTRETVERALAKCLKDQTPEPQEMVSKLVGRRVRLTLTTGTKREGTVLGCGPQGFQLTSGIGGRMIFHYGEVDGIDDLGESK